jgi:hypothetical protein
MKLTLDQVLRWGVDRQYLGATKATDPVAVARRLSGVHAQVAASACPAIDLRTRATVTTKTIDALLYNKRRLIRTWAARGTLHLLPADDLPTWVAAMSTTTRETTGSWLKYHGVTAAQNANILSALPDVLGADPLTRDELADSLIGATGHEDPATATHPGLRRTAQAGCFFAACSVRGRRADATSHSSRRDPGSATGLPSRPSQPSTRSCLPTSERMDRRARTSSPAGSTSSRRLRRSRSLA